MVLVVTMLLGVLAGIGSAWAQGERVVDIPTRPGVTQRFIVVAPGDVVATIAGWMLR